jgi:hypothetical protein
MRKTLLLIISYLLITPAMCAETILKSAEITSVLTDVVLYATVNGQPADQIFQKSGVTFYNAAGNQSQGTWKVEGDQYCSTWPPNPSLSCYNVARDGNKITFIAKDGKRFEMSITK